MRQQKQQQQQQQQQQQPMAGELSSAASCSPRRAVAV